MLASYTALSISTEKTAQCLCYRYDGLAWFSTHWNYGTRIPKHKGHKMFPVLMDKAHFFWSGLFLFEHIGSNVCARSLLPTHLWEEQEIPEPPFGAETRLYSTHFLWWERRQHGTWIGCSTLLTAGKSRYFNTTAWARHKNLHRTAWCGAQSLKMYSG